jgi:hypothetical protein
MSTNGRRTDMTTTTTEWVVKHETDDLYWNNDLGYVDRASATVFTNDERLMYHLPLEGTWTEAN